MTDDQHGEGTPRGTGRWDPLPQGDYDDGATAFVNLPEGGVDALLAAADSPLAAPGQGYVPPRIGLDPAGGQGADPLAPDPWPSPAPPTDGAGWSGPDAVPGGGPDDRFTYQHPGATGQWTFTDTGTTGAPPAPGQDVTGQWSIPVAGGDLPDESGEFSTSSLVEQWGGTPPATLPGGAPAPWASEGAGQPWGQQATELGDTGFDTGADTGSDTGFGEPTDTGYGSGPHTDEQPHTPAQAADIAAPPDAHGVREVTGAEADAEVDADAQGAAGEAVGGAVGAEAEPAAPDATRDAVRQDAVRQDAVAQDVVRQDAVPQDIAEAADPAPPMPPTSLAPPGEEHPLASYVLRVNGVERPVADAWIGESLLYVLRERLGLAGAKDGCSQGECGACNVQVDGRLVASCLVPAVTAAGSEVRTVEGLAVDGQPSDVQRALARCGAVQCGFCVPGMAMTVHDLLEGNPAPSELETRQALCGNLCRCSGYRGVVDAVKDVVAEREAHAHATAETDADEARIPHQAGPGAGGVNPSAFQPAGPHDQTYGNGPGTGHPSGPGTATGNASGTGQDGGQV